MSNEEIKKEETKDNPFKDIIISESMIFTKNPAVTIREEIEEDGKYVLFNEENEIILIINSTGKFILENCNGKNDLVKIAELIRKEFKLEDKTIDLNNVIKEFIKLLIAAKLVIRKED